MYVDDQADLRTLHQAYSSQIEFSKTQFWRVANYAIWALAAIYGLFKAFLKDWPGAAIFSPAMTFVVSSICLYNMHKCWLSMRDARRRFRKIRSRLSATFREIFTSPGEDSLRYNYHYWTYDAWFVVPIITLLLVGSVLTHCLMIHELKNTNPSGSWWQPLRRWLQWPENSPSCIAAGVCVVLLALYFARHWSRGFDKCLKKCGRWCHVRCRRQCREKKEKTMKGYYIAALFVIGIVLVVLLTFFNIWLYPSLLLLTLVICLLVSLNYWEGHQWKTGWKDLLNCYYWPREDRKPHRSPLLLIMHFFSFLIRCTSALQYSKAFYKAKKSEGKGTVPAWLIEFYMLLWIAYIGTLGFQLSQTATYSWLLLAILLYRAIHVVHGNMYYGVLRSMYVGKHDVHNVSRNLALLLVSYIELCLLFAAVYLTLRDQFHPTVSTLRDALYLSVTTITTVGYGDIRPINSTARLVLGLEAVSGLALLGLAITRFLGMIPKPKDLLHPDEEE